MITGKTNKLHLGCGNIYLEGYTNIDLYETNSKIAKKCTKEELAVNSTTLDQYYKYPRMEGYPQEMRNIADLFWDILQIDKAYQNNTIDDIVCIQVLEHFRKQDAHLLLLKCYDLLKEGGRMVISVPDIEGYAFDLVDIKEDQKDWEEKIEATEKNMRYIYGSQKRDDGRSVHRHGYTLSSLIYVLTKAGFKKDNIKVSNIIRHDYPAIVVEVFK